MCVENWHIYYIPVNYNNYKVEYNVQKKNYYGNYCLFKYIASIGSVVVVVVENVVSIPFTLIYNLWNS